MHLLSIKGENSEINRQLPREFIRISNPKGVPINFKADPGPKKMDGSAHLPGAKGQRIQKVQHRADRVDALLQGNTVSLHAERLQQHAIFQNLGVHIVAVLLGEFREFPNNLTLARCDQQRFTVSRYRVFHCPAPDILDILLPLLGNFRGEFHHGKPLFRKHHGKLPVQSESCNRRLLLGAIVLHVPVIPLLIRPHNQTNFFVELFSRVFDGLQRVKGSQKRSLVVQGAPAINPVI